MNRGKQSRGALLGMLCFLALLGAPAPLLADDRPVLVILSPAAAEPPFLCQGFKGTPMEAIETILSLLAEKMDIRLERRCLPWKRAMDALRFGDVDAMYPLYRTPAREQFLDYPDEPFFTLDTVFFTHKDSGITWTGDLAELQSVTINVVRGRSHGEPFDNADYLTKWESPDATEMIRMVHGRRHELGIFGLLPLLTQAEKMGVLEDLTFLEPPAISDDVYLGFSRTAGHKRLIEDFSRELKAFKQTEQYREMVRKYGLE